MKRIATSLFAHSAIAFALVACLVVSTVRAQEESSGESDAGIVRCANLIYAKEKSSVCFSDEFLTQIAEETNVRTHSEFHPVKLDSMELYEHPFAVMTGEGAFEMTSAQREAMVDYLRAGGFVVASAGCSSDAWNRSFRTEMKKMFPDTELTKLDADHPIFHTVYDVTQTKYKSGETRLPDLRALTIEDRVVMVWSPDGLNDTESAGPDCCCCGGNEIKSARQVNVNILAYALTH